MTDRFFALSRFAWISLATAVFPQSFTDMLQRLESEPVETRRTLADGWLRRNPSIAFPVTDDSLANFVFINDTVRTVSVAGDFNQWNPGADSLMRVPGTDWFVLTRAFESDARLDYKFVLDGRNWILDPRNPATCTGGYGPNSEFAMPGYVPPKEIRCNPDISHGTLDTLSFRSAILNNDRNVFVYRPPAYLDSSTDRFPTLYVNDGGEYLALGSMRNVLDNLIHSGKIRETIVVFINPVDRNREYWMNAKYGSMLSDELVPWIDARYWTIPKPSMRGIFGASLGGLSAVDAAVSHQDVFGLCASQSGAFWVDDEAVVARVRSAPVINGRFYLDWGAYEPSIQDIHLKMCTILRAKGCDVKVMKFHEGHSWGSWRAHLDEALTFLFPK
jgi:enterochelin esterase family protein